MVVCDSRVETVGSVEHFHSELSSNVLRLCSGSAAKERKVGKVRDVSLQAET